MVTSYPTLLKVGVITKITLAVIEFGSNPALDLQYAAKNIRHHSIAFILPF